MVRQNILVKHIKESESQYSSIPFIGMPAMTYFLHLVLLHFSVAPEAGDQPFSLLRERM